MDAFVLWVVRFNVACLFYLTPACGLAYLFQQVGLPPAGAFCVAALVLMGAVMVYRYRRQP